jgi:hypothetical protein
LVRSRLPILLVGFVLGVLPESAGPAFFAMMTDVVPQRDRLRTFSPPTRSSRPGPRRRRIGLNYGRSTGRVGGVGVTAHAQ